MKVHGSTATVLYKRHVKGKSGIEICIPVLYVYVSPLTSAPRFQLSKGLSSTSSSFLMKTSFLSLPIAQHSFDAFHQQQNIHITQYSPFGNQNEFYSSGKDIGKLIDDPTLAEIGTKYNKSGAQVALAWGIAHGRSVIPKSKTPSRIKANLEGDFTLEPEDVEKIDAMDKKMRFNDSSESFGWNFFADLDGKR